MLFELCQRDVLSRFSAKRDTWSAWNGRFEVIKVDDRFGIQCRELAAQAVETMNGLEEAVLRDSGIVEKLGFVSLKDRNDEHEGQYENEADE